MDTDRGECWERFNPWGERLLSVLERWLLAAAASIAVVTLMLSALLYSELERVRLELGEARRVLSEASSEISGASGAVEHGLIVSVDVVVRCGNDSLACRAVRTYAGAPVLLAISSCTSLEVRGNGQSLEVVLVPGFGEGRSWAPRVCRGFNCSRADLLQRLWGGEEVILECARG